MLPDDEIEQVDPITGLGEGAVGQHEMYLAWREAGFTETQAMELLKVVITELIRVVNGEC
jgi:hypothetical protein